MHEQHIKDGPPLGVGAALPSGEEAIIREGDDVLIYLDLKRTWLVEVRPDRELHTHKGVIKLSDLVGLPFGSRVRSSTGHEFVVLKPTIRDYVLKMRRATQIIYPKDVGLILAFTGIGPGWRVVEGGTGSGALTAFLAYHVKPDGRVYSYEVRPEFLKVAEANLRRAGLLGVVELKLADVTEGIEERDVDAVVLDIAAPWEAVPHAHEALRPSGSFASFSPTIDQVVKTVAALREHGFVAIEVVECLLRHIRAEPGKTRPEWLMRAHTGYMVFARKALPGTVGLQKAI